MFEAGDIREWRGHGVVDPSGHKIGTLEAVYVDTATDQPFFATVTVGLPTRRRLVFVPLSGATVGPGYLKIAHPKDVVKKAPAIDTDGELPAEDEPGIFAHYELDYAPGAGGERRLARR
ncbi:PRC-barrel domain-containing protein [Streptomyces sp. NPDC001537]